MAYRDAVLADRPVGYWLLGDTGSTALDQTLGSNGAVTSAAVAPGLLVGTPRSSYSFDASLAIVNVPSTTALSITADMTLELWMKPTSAAVAATTVVCEKGSDTVPNCSYGIGWSSADSKMCFVHNNAFVATSTYVVTTGLQHVVCTRTGGGINYWVNGAYHGFVTYGANNPASNSQSIGLGGRGNLVSGIRYGGLLSDVAVYNYVLSQGRIEAHALIGFGLLARDERRRRAR